MGLSSSEQRLPTWAISINFRIIGDDGPPIWLELYEFRDTVEEVVPQDVSIVHGRPSPRRVCSQERARRPFVRVSLETDPCTYRAALEARQAVEDSVESHWAQTMWGDVEIVEKARLTGPVAAPTKACGANLSTLRLKDCRGTLLGWAVRSYLKPRQRLTPTGLVGIVNSVGIGAIERDWPGAFEPYLRPIAMHEDNLVLAARPTGPRRIEDVQAANLDLIRTGPETVAGTVESVLWWDEVPLVTDGERLVEAGRVVGRDRSGLIKEMSRRWIDRGVEEVAEAEHGSFAVLVGGRRVAAAKPGVDLGLGFCPSEAKLIQLLDAPCPRCGSRSFEIAVYEERVATGRFYRTNHVVTYSRYRAMCTGCNTEYPVGVDGRPPKWLRDTDLVDLADRFRASRHWNNWNKGQGLMGAIASFLTDERFEDRQTAIQPALRPTSTDDIERFHDVILAVQDPA